MNINTPPLLFPENILPHPATMTLALQSIGPWSSITTPQALARHPKYYFQDSLTTFLVSPFARCGPRLGLNARLESPQVENQLFRVHRCGS